MPQITIDGKAFDYDGQHMLLQFALDHGVEIPYFCYHPAMSIPTNCRMCLVDVGFPTRDRVTNELKLDENGAPVIMWGRKAATACKSLIAGASVQLRVLGAIFICSNPGCSGNTLATPASTTVKTKLC